MVSIGQNVGQLQNVFSNTRDHVGPPTPIDWKLRTSTEKRGWVIRPLIGFLVRGAEIICPQTNTHKGKKFSSEVKGTNPEKSMTAKKVTLCRP